MNLLQQIQSCSSYVTLQAVDYFKDLISHTYYSRTIIMFRHVCTSPYIYRKPAPTLLLQIKKPKTLIILDKQCSGSLYRGRRAQLRRYLTLR